MAFYFSSVTKALYDTDVFPVASLPANKVEISEAAYAELMTKQNQGYVILANGSGNPYTVNQSEASATDIKHAASVATTVALGHVKIGNTMTAANDGTLDMKDGAVGTSKLADDAITADKVKDNETLPVNISGSANSLRGYITQKSGIAVGSVQYQELGTSPVRSTAGGPTIILLQGQGDIGKLPSTWIFTFNCRESENVVMEAYSFGPTYSRIMFGYWKDSSNIYHLFAKYPAWCRASITIQCINKDYGFTFDVKNATSTEPTGASYAPTYNAVSAPYGQNVGNQATPIYVAANGHVQPCDASPFIINKMVKEDGTDFGYYVTIPFAVGYDEGFKTIGKLNISPSNKNCIIDITFMVRFKELDENDNSKETPAATFAVFVGNTEISTYYLAGSIDPLDPNFNHYESSPSFRCTFSANINNTIYIKVKKTSYYARKLDLYDFKVQGLAFYTN